MSPLLRPAYLTICSHCGRARIIREGIVLCEPFWTKPDGLDVIRELKSEGNISAEEFEFLREVIQASKLPEYPLQRLEGLAALVFGVQTELAPEHDEKPTYH